MKINFPLSLHRKTLRFALIIASMISYLEWGNGNHTFLVQAELEIIGKLFTDTDTISHPLIILPLLGQALLFFTLFQSNPHRILVLSAILGLGVLLWFIFLIGLIALNLKIILFALPFLLISILVLYTLRNERNGFVKNS